ncbi:MAG: hypothetical protein IPO08_22785 [Xanthomonadales bacterium]|nr:hypothetical protein [Xanthomonadales bacterium]
MRRPQMKTAKIGELSATGETEAKARAAVLEAACEALSGSYDGRVLWLYSWLVILYRDPWQNWSYVLIDQREQSTTATLTTGCISQDLGRVRVSNCALRDEAEADARMSLAMLIYGNDGSTEAELLLSTPAAREQFRDWCKFQNCYGVWRALGYDDQVCHQRGGWYQLPDAAQLTPEQKIDWWLFAAPASPTLNQKRIEQNIWPVADALGRYRAEVQPWPTL